MKFNKKYAGIITSLCMTTLMVTVVSFVMTIINVGFNEILMFAFLKSLSISLCVAVPTSFLLMPVVGKIVDNLTE